MTMTLTLIIPCPVCQSGDGHAEGCEREAIERLRARSPIIQCPICHDGKVDLNVDDLYECRDCRVQFSTAAGVADDTDLLVLLDRRPTDYSAIDAWVLPTKGEGKFRYDEAIEKLEKSIAEKLGNDDSEQ